MLSKLETILESKTIRVHLKNQINNVSEELQEKFYKLQAESNEDCNYDVDNETRKIFYDLDNVNSVSCGLGCQLHGISAAFVCAFENNRKLNIINYQRNQYAQYFNSFKSKCKLEHQFNASRISSKHNGRKTLYRKTSLLASTTK